jgi:mannose-6-phosphate isomerase-like protein (cupin superfamily)
MKLATAIAMAVFALPCTAQSPGKAEVFSSTQIHGQLVQLAQQGKAKGSSGATLGDYGTHAIKLSERTVSGGAEIHSHFDDVMIVMEGNATLISGGELIDAHAGSNGESTGSGIRNGVVQSISTGDVVHVPAGIPHQLLIAPGTSYSALVIKVKE